MLVAALAGPALGCGVFRRGPDTPPAAAQESPPPPLPVEKVEEDVIVAAWAEPSRLPPMGGQTQILVRLQKRGGVPFGRGAGHERGVPDSAAEPPRGLG